MKIQVLDQREAFPNLACNASVKPFRIKIPQAQLEGLSDRLARTRWPGEPSDVGWCPPQEFV